MSHIISYRRGALYRIKLTSGEEVLVSFAKTGFKIIQLKYFGLMPSRTVVDWPAAKNDEALKHFKDEPDDTLWEAVGKKVVACESIAEIEKFCAAHTV